MNYTLRFIQLAIFVMLIFVIFFLVRRLPKDETLVKGYIYNTQVDITNEGNYKLTIYCRYKYQTVAYEAVQKHVSIPYLQQGDSVNLMVENDSPENYRVVSKVSAKQPKNVVIKLSKGQ